MSAQAGTEGLGAFLGSGINLTALLQTKTFPGLGDLTRLPLEVEAGLVGLGILVAGGLGALAYRRYTSTRSRLRFRKGPPILLSEKEREKLQPFFGNRRIPERLTWQDWKRIQKPFHKEVVYSKGELFIIRSMTLWGLYSRAFRNFYYIVNDNQKGTLDLSGAKVSTIDVQNKRCLNSEDDTEKHSDFAWSRPLNPSEDRSLEILPRRKLKKNKD
jgi:hypothetical protein